MHWKAHSKYVYFEPKGKHLSMLCEKGSDCQYKMIENYVPKLGSCFQKYPQILASLRINSNLKTNCL